jgi:hypothetical protein
MLEFLTTTTAAIDMQYPVDISITTDTGVRKCQAVFWIWMKDITKHLRNTWPNHYSALNPNGTDMHDKVCQWFLGMTKAKKFGREVTAPMQKTLTSPKMSTGEMIDLLRRIEEWAISQNIPLNQERSEYTEAR